MSFDTEPMFATGGALRGAVARRLLAHDAVPEAAAGTRIGAFEIREPIGRGGMGAVFRAERVEGGFEQTVAIKRMSATDATTRERFRAEMEILARLAHPNIAQLVDGGVCADGSLYLAMEYVDGEPIDDYCERRGLGTDERIRLLLRIADALAHAHRSLVIHRDIKPSNILVRRSDGRPKLLDFGIAKLYGEAQDRELTQQGFGPMPAASHHADNLASAAATCPGIAASAHSGHDMRSAGTPRVNAVTASRCQRSSARGNRRAATECRISRKRVSAADNGCTPKAAVPRSTNTI